MKAKLTKIDRVRTLGGILLTVVTTIGWTLPAPAICEKKDLYPIVGDRGILRTEARDAQVWVSTTISSSYVAVMATVEHNESPVQAKTGELFQVPSGTEVVVVSVPDDGGLCEVREVQMLSGHFAGHKGFVVYSWVARTPAKSK